VKWALNQLHEQHGHFSAEICMQASFGQFYWPTRRRDIKAHCASCWSCQLLTPPKPSQTILPILSHQPLDLIGFDLIGPIFPPSDDGHRFIFVIVDYMTCMAWADDLIINSGDACWECLERQVLRVYGLPLGTYSDNGVNSQTDRSRRDSDEET
jgi:hypothetical protein